MIDAEPVVPEIEEHAGTGGRSAFFSIQSDEAVFILFACSGNFLKRLTAVYGNEEITDEKGYSGNPLCFVVLARL